MVDVCRKDFRAVQAILLFTVIKADNYTTTLNGACVSDFYPCNNGRCIESVLVCNSVDNCGDNSDETDVCKKKEEISDWTSYIWVFAIFFVIIACFSWVRYQRRRRRNRAVIASQTGYPPVPDPTPNQTQSYFQGHPSTTTTTDMTLTGYMPWSTQTSLQPPPYSRDGPGSVPSAPPPPYSTVVSEYTIDPPFSGFTYYQPRGQRPYSRSDLSVWTF